MSSAPHDPVPSGLLPGTAQRDRLERGLRLRPDERVEVPGELRRAAVALVFRPGSELLFIRRAERKGDPWSGHMAFPGGRKDPEDPDLVSTAVRETREEVGLDLSRAGVHLLGRLDELASPRGVLRPRMVISPFVFWDPDPPELRPNYEVADTFWFPMHRFEQDEGRGSMTIPWKGNRVRFPVVNLEGARIWGLTLGILDGLLDRLRLAEDAGLREAGG